MSELPNSPNADAPQRDWAGLSYDLLELIADKIESSADYLRFAAVCVSWLSIARNNLSKHNTKYCHQAPLLLIPDKHKHKWRAYDVMKEKFLESKLYVPYKRRFCGSLDGWLFGVNKDSTVTLHKPGHQKSPVHLPCIFPHEFPPGRKREPNFIDPAEVSDYHVQRAIVKSDEKASSSELTVVAIYGEFLELAYIRHGKDATWSKIDAGKLFVDVLHYKNQFYAINYWDVLVSFNDIDSLTAIQFVTSEESELECCNKYLVKSPEGELLLVKRYLDWPEDESLTGEDWARTTDSFFVYQFDFDGKKLIELTSLGNMALFLGDNSSISVLASNFPGCQPNCIYFTHDNDEILSWGNSVICDLGVYNMESKSFKLHYTIDPAALKTMSKRPPIWYAPRILL